MKMQEILEINNGLVSFNDAANFEKQIMPFKFMSMLKQQVLCVLKPQIPCSSMTNFNFLFQKHVKKQRFMCKQ